jgi:hypothetical protein
VSEKRMWGGRLLTEEAIDKYKIQHKRYFEKYPDKMRQYSNAYHKRQRDAVFNHYGNFCA